MARVEINRDPFARRSLERITLNGTGYHRCAWCGGKAKFRYAWVPDTLHHSAANWSPPMCTVGCYRAYSE